MLNDFPKLRRWEETDDVLQTAMMRMIRALDEVRPESVRDFLRLASLQIRRQLLDFTRYYYGAEGPGRHHHSVPPGSMNDHRRPASNAPDASDSTWEPQQVAQWTLLHESVERLGSELVEIFDLVWYQGLPLVEAARLLGISERTAQRRWQLVRIELSEQLDNQLPGI
jgi:RNA polymerase sigma-70 factor (ECF subfamily)